MSRTLKVHSELDEKKLLNELMTWRPNTDWKKRFLDSDVYLTFLNCGRGSGKTAIFCRKALMYALRNPGAVLILAAPVNNQIESVVFSTFKKICPPTLLNYCFDNNLYHATYRRLTLPNGSVIYFRSCDNYDSFRGMEAAFVAIDEARDMPKRDAFDVLISVLRQPGYKYQMVVSSTPSPKIKWIKDEYIKEYPKETVVKEIILDDNGGEHEIEYMWFHGTPMENGAVDAGYVPRLRKTYGEGSLAKQEIYADWIDLTGLCFGNFENNLVELFKKSEYEKGGSGRSGLNIPTLSVESIVGYGQDWGRVSPNIVCLHDRKSDISYVIDESYLEDKGTGEIVSEAKRLEWLYGIGPHIGDPSHKPDMKELELNGMRVVDANKRDVVFRINFIHELLRMGKLFIDKNKCVNLIREMSNLTWDDNKLKGNTVGDDHCIDALGYALLYLRRKKEIYRHHFCVWY